MTDGTHSLERQLMALPLFLGMSSNDISQLLTAFTLSFHQYNDERPVVTAGQQCTQLIILAKGRLTISSTPDDQRFHIDEEVEAPYLIQPERLFGLNTRYTRSFSTQRSCQLIGIGKNDVMKIASQYQVFHINLLNTICTQAQRYARTPWAATPADVRARILLFIDSHCLLPTGRKHIMIRMTQLARELNESRKAVSDELHRMHADHLITLRRESIDITL